MSSLNELLAEAENEVASYNLSYTPPKINRPFRVAKRSFTFTHEAARSHYRFLLDKLGLKAMPEVNKSPDLSLEMRPIDNARNSKGLFRYRIPEIYDKSDGYMPGPINMQKSNFTENTTYVRASNDYTMSPHQEHERWARDQPVSTSVVAITDMPYTEVHNLIQFMEEHIKAEDNGLTLVRRNSIEFHEDIDPENPNEDEYSLFKQQCLVFSNTVDILTVEILAGFKSTCVTFFKSANLKSDVVERVMENKNRFKTYVKKKKEATFYTISQNARGFVLEDLEIRKRINESEILDNYNDDFEKAHDVINQCIDEGKRGLILLHGIPGSGKTSYIKHLITKSGKRKIVYIPPHLAASIASPNFISFVKSDLADSVLVIEDAEQILLSRENIESHKEAVSNILNMTDGILADALNILIICTFNTDMENIDSALRRKGRMMLQYKFEELSVTKANNLTEKLYGKSVNKAMPLSEIFNLDYELIQPAEKPRMAFGFRADK